MFPGPPRGGCGEGPNAIHFIFSFLYEFLIFSIFNIVLFWNNFYLISKFFPFPNIKKSYINYKAKLIIQSLNSYDSK